MWEPGLSGWHPEVMQMQRDTRKATPFRPRDSYQDYLQQPGDRVTIQTINHASHALLHEQPEAVALKIEQWVKDHDL